MTTAAQINHGTTEGSFVMLNASLCESLDDKRRWICEGLDRMTPRKRAIYLRHWLAIGAIDPEAGRTLLASTHMLDTNETQANSDQSKPRGGVGTELKTMLKSLGFAPKKTCGCNSLAAEMDRIGVKACEISREKYVDRLREAYRSTSIWEGIRAAGMAVLSGVAWRVDFSDPVAWAFDESVRLAAEKAVDPIHSDLQCGQGNDSGDHAE